MKTGEKYSVNCSVLFDFLNNYFSVTSEKVTTPTLVSTTSPSPGISITCKFDFLKVCCTICLFYFGTITT